MATLAALAVVCAAAWLTDRFEPLERRWYDLMVAATPAATSPDLAIVAIDSPSVAALGPWPWSRELLAQVVDALNSAGARTIVLTMPQAGSEGEPALAQLQRIAGTVTEDPDLAAHPRLTGLLLQAQEVLDADAHLAASMRHNGHVLLSAGIVRPSGSPEGGVAVQWPLAALSAAALGVGHADWQPDPDGVVRSHTPLIDISGRHIASLSLWIWAQARGVGIERLKLRALQRDLQLGPASVPLDGAGRLRLLPGTDGAAAIPHLSAHELLAGKIAPQAIAGKTILVGLTATGTTPLLRLASEQLITPVDLLALTTAGLLGNHLVAHPGWVEPLGLLLLVGVAAYLILVVPQLAPVSALALSSLLGTTLLLVSHIAFTQGHLWLTLMLPLLGLISGHAALLLWQLAARRWSNGPRPTHAALPGRSAEDPFELSLLQEPPAPASAVTRSPAPPTPARPATAPAPLPPPAPAMPSAPAAPATVAAPPGPPSQRPITQAPNSRWPSLGRFQLDRELGHGAMGRVYLAHELETSRVVVIKTLSLSQEFEGISLQEARRRFLREAEAAGRLQHPNIVRIHETGEERGMAYIAMEWLHGRNLVLHTQMHNLLPVADVLEIGARIADALAYAHSQGVIHRDIKPANVMVDPSRGQVTVTDFGIARIIDGRSTRTGLMLGSPLYMSPEQLLGRAIDGRSDLYALGVMLFQLLTGELPSRGDSIAELISAITTQEAPDVRTLRPDLPQPVAEVVALALEKPPELRYRNGQDLAADLRLVAAQLLQQASTPAVPPRPSATVEDVALGSAALWPAADSSGAIVHNRHG